MGPGASRAGRREEGTHADPISRSSFLRRWDDELRGGPSFFEPSRHAASASPGASGTPREDDWQVDYWSGSGLVHTPLAFRWYASDCDDAAEDALIPRPAAVEACDLPRTQSAGSRDGPATHYSSSPAPPVQLWDEARPDYLEKVRCRARIRLIGINAKLGTFHLRMRCHWSFRASSLDEQAEVDFRGTPGIRMPGVSVAVEESRIWKDVTQTGLTTIFWRGTSLFAITGHKAFRMEDFPYDRHILNLEKLEFVWRFAPFQQEETEACDYFKSMDVVDFTVLTYSMVPEWRPFPAYVIARDETSPVGDLGVPTCCSQFTLRLRIQRKHWYYARQVFLISTCITCVSCFPLAIPNKRDFVDERLDLYMGGLLTLITFKYGINKVLPSVPYTTFLDNFLLLQVVMLAWLSLQTCVGFGLRDMLWWLEIAWDWSTNLAAFISVLLFWVLCTAYSFYVRPYLRKPWSTVMRCERECGNLDEFESPDELDE
ncbi:unnamed protein product [Prorocentrum cordatum]|uniref:Neurotransmitter-gated ion-channel ligand-binding domain-containing protein n=1 Tax=Prorocentrum cordatum TaxID=2364126 RepID=A0ABN9TP15_9DINO|nr:unnamed protein product [Polarella glacialis]